MYYSLIGTTLTVVIGIIGSYLTQDPKDSYDAKLLHPLVLKFYQRFKGEKPYYVKEINAGVGSIGNISGSGNGSGARINHAFEAQNETNIIIDVGKNDKDKDPMEAIFTQKNSNTSSPPKHATANADYAANDVTNSNCNSNLETPKKQHIFSVPSLDNKLAVNDITGSYRPITEKENV